VAANDVWAVGGPLVEHYDGTTWKVVTAPVTATTTLDQIARIPRTRRLWAVGADTATETPVAILSTGRRWRAHDPPGSGVLGGVAALGRRNVWASGEGADGTTNLTVHWNGSAWKVVASAGLANGAIANMTRAPGSRLLWAVGTDLATAGPFAAYRH
jgi:uncharacterized membrane protein